MWSSDRRAILLGLLSLPGCAALTACGFQPLYGEGTPARATQGRVEVRTDAGAEGFLMRERLVQLLGPPSSPSHLLEVELEIETEGTALTRENVTTRFDVIGLARYRLFPVDGGPAVIDDEARAVAGYSAPESETASAFAARAAEADARTRVVRTLAERIAERLALRAGEWAA
jgi:LPS-assembly lipoprotein